MGKKNIPRCVLTNHKVQLLPNLTTYNNKLIHQQYSNVTTIMKQSLFQQVHTKCLCVCVYLSTVLSIVSKEMKRLMISRYKATAAQMYSSYEYRLIKLSVSYTM